MSDPTATATPRRAMLVPIIGALGGAAAGFAYYWFFGCDSG